METTQVSEALAPVSSNNSSTAALPAMSTSFSTSTQGVTVAVRVRPLSDKEKGRGDVKVWKALREQACVSQTTTDGKPVPNSAYTFDAAFDENVSTLDIYNSVASPIVKNVVEGINGTIFAYGKCMRFLLKHVLISVPNLLYTIALARYQFLYPLIKLPSSHCVVYCVHYCRSNFFWQDLHYAR